MNLTEEQIKNLKEYEQIKISIKSLEERLTELKPLIVTLVEVDQVFKTQQGSFTKRKMIKWKYSQAVADLQDDEKARGVAKEVEIFALVYSQKKEAHD